MAAEGASGTVYVFGGDSNANTIGYSQGNDIAKASFYSQSLAVSTASAFAEPARSSSCSSVASSATGCLHSCSAAAPNGRSSSSKKRDDSGELCTGQLNLTSTSIPEDVRHSEAHVTGIAAMGSSKKVLPRETSSTREADANLVDRAIGQLLHDGSKQYSAPLSHAYVNQTMCANNADGCAGPFTVQCHHGSPVAVPYGWLRMVENDHVVYVSPTGQRLASDDDVRRYLLRDDTCKCGLPCPVFIPKLFCFSVACPRQACRQSDHGGSLPTSGAAVATSATGVTEKCASDPAVRECKHGCVQLAAPDSVQSVADRIGTKIARVLSYSIRKRAEAVVKGTQKKSLCSKLPNKYGSTPVSQLLACRNAKQNFHEVSKAGRSTTAAETVAAAESAHQSNPVPALCVDSPTVGTSGDQDAQTMYCNQNDSPTLSNPCCSTMSSDAVMACTSGICESSLNVTCCLPQLPCSRQLVQAEKRVSSDGKSETMSVLTGAAVIRLSKKRVWTRVRKPDVSIGVNSTESVSLTGVPSSTFTNVAAGRWDIPLVKSASCESASGSMTAQDHAANAALPLPHAEDVFWSTNQVRPTASQKVIPEVGWSPSEAGHQHKDLSMSSHSRAAYQGHEQPTWPLLPSCDSRSGALVSAVPAKEGIVSMLKMPCSVPASSSQHETRASSVNSEQPPPYPGASVSVFSSGGTSVSGISARPHAFDANAFDPPLMVRGLPTFGFSTGNWMYNQQQTPLATAQQHSSQVQRSLPTQWYFTRTTDESLCHQQSTATPGHRSGISYVSGRAGCRTAADDMACSVLSDPAMTAENSQGMATQSRASSDTFVPSFSCASYPPWCAPAYGQGYAQQPIHALPSVQSLQMPYPVTDATLGASSYKAGYGGRHRPPFANQSFSSSALACQPWPMRPLCTDHWQYRPAMQSWVHASYAPGTGCSSPPVHRALTWPESGYAAAAAAGGVGKARAGTTKSRAPKTKRSRSNYETRTFADDDQDESRASSRVPRPCSSDVNAAGLTRDVRPAMDELLLGSAPSH